MTAVIDPTRGRDLETDIRAALDATGEPSVFVLLRTKLFEAWRAWRIDASMETGAGTWAIDGYDVRLQELTGADRRIAVRLLGMR